MATSGPISWKSRGWKRTNVNCVSFPEIHMYVIKRPKVVEILPYCGHLHLYGYINEISITADWGFVMRFEIELRPQNINQSVWNNATLDTDSLVWGSLETQSLHHNTDVIVCTCCERKHCIGGKCQLFPDHREQNSHSRRIKPSPDRRECPRCNKTQSSGAVVNKSWAVSLLPFLRRYPSALIKLSATNGRNSGTILAAVIENICCPSSEHLQKKNRKQH